SADPQDRELGILRERSAAHAGEAEVEGRRWTCGRPDDDVILARRRERALDLEILETDGGGLQRESACELSGDEAQIDLRKGEARVDGDVAELRRVVCPEREREVAEQGVP